MGQLDFSEILIILGLAAMLALAVHNKAHHHVPK